MIPASITAAAPGLPARPAAGLPKPVAAKRGRRGAEPGATTVAVSLPPDLLRALQAWTSTRPEPRPDLPAVIRFALRDWLMARQLRDHLGQSDG